MSFKRSFLHGFVFFRTALPYSGGSQLERGWMPLLMVKIGQTVKKGTTTENQSADVKYMG